MMDAVVKECLTDLDQVSFTMEWTIENFSRYQGRAGLLYNEGITMTELGFGDEYQGRWRIVVNPCFKKKEYLWRENAERELGYCEASLCITDIDSASQSYTGLHVIDGKFTLWVASGKAVKVVREHQAAVWVYSTNNEHKWITAFCYDSRSVNYREIQDNCVTFRVNVVVYTAAKHVRVLDPIIPTAIDINRNLSKFVKRQMEAFRSDQQPKTSDFVIRSKDGIEFHAHRFVLMAQSPVFAAMLTHESREKQLSRCELQDVDAESIGVLLDYVYGSDTSKVTKDNTEKVLIMADKYEMMDLRGFCEQTLADSISMEKALPYLVLSVQRGLDVLKAAALRMMPKYLDAVLKGKGLEEVMQSDPELIQIIMEYCGKKLPHL